MANIFETFSESALKAVIYAQEEAIAFDSSFVGLDHLLIGLTETESNTVAALLIEKGFSRSKARQTISEQGYEKLKIKWPMPQCLKVVVRRLKAMPFSPDMVALLKVIKAQEYTTVTPNHLLLALLENAPAKVLHILESQNISVEELRNSIQT